MNNSIFILFFLSIQLSFSQHKTVTREVSANTCGWHAQILLDPGERVYITGYGSWKSNGETFNHRGVRNDGHKGKDKRSIVPRMHVMSVVAVTRFHNDNENQYSMSMDSKGYIEYTNNHDKQLRMFFACNDDLRNKDHCNDNSGSIFLNIDFYK